MALTVQARVNGFDLGNTFKYYYLYEPLPILATETDLTARELLVDLRKIDPTNSSIVENYIEYGKYDINPGVSINIDLMKLVQQAFNSDIWKISSINDLQNDYDRVVSKYEYELDLRTDSPSPNIATVKIVPILGGRLFVDYQAVSGTPNFLNDFEKNGVDISGRWLNYPIINTTIQNPDNSQKTITTISTETNGCEPKAGMLFWKSRLGGWMQWGFDLKTEKSKPKYNGRIQVGMFDISRGEIGVEPFVPTNYSSVNYTNSLTLKSLSLSKEELRAVNSINESPICYYLKSPNSRLELMRMSSATVPLDLISNGGDFQVSLSNISQTEFKTR